MAAKATTANPMLASELRSSISLASLFGLRMLGLFLVLPVFALEAAKYPGGDNPALVGLAMGIFGLTQALLQIPYGLASDRLGRKPVILFGLLVFAAGSFIAASADTVMMLLIGRAIQGAGAISAAVTALLADQTRESVRTKGMAFVGGTIGLMFAVSLIASPILSAPFGLAGLFAITGVLAVLGIAVLLFVTPPEPERKPAVGPGRLGGLGHALTDPHLLRLHTGTFSLYAAQMAMWVTVPAMLVDAGVAKAQHWHVYLPAVIASFVAMGLTLFPMERRGKLKEVFLAHIALLLLAQLGFLLAPHSAWILGALLFVCFCCFNVLEASQPSMVSRIAPPDTRGAALGVFNTLQSLGLFTGGAAGGLIAKAFGAPAVFVFAALLLGFWFVVALPMQRLSHASQSAVPKNIEEEGEPYGVR